MGARPERPWHRGKRSLSEFAAMQGKQELLSFERLPCQQAPKGLGDFAATRHQHIVFAQSHCVIPVPGGSARRPQSKRQMSFAAAPCAGLVAATSGRQTAPAAVPAVPSSSRLVQQRVCSSGKAFTADRSECRCFYSARHAVWHKTCQGNGARRRCGVVWCERRRQPEAALLTLLSSTNMWSRFILLVCCV